MATYCTRAFKEANYYLLSASEIQEKPLAVSLNRVSYHLHKFMCSGEHELFNCQEDTRVLIAIAICTLITTGSWSMNFEDGWIKAEKIEEEK